MLAWTWLKWPDVLVDYGRELYIPWQLTQGKMLYRDLAYFNGPVSPYLNALFFQMAGVSLRTQLVANALVLLVCMVLLYQLMLQLAGRWAATVGVVVFVLLFALAQYAFLDSYNFLSPYSHEMTHGFALLLGALTAFAQLAKRITYSAAGILGGLLGLLFLTKPELFVAAALPTLAGSAWLAWRQRSRRVWGAMALMVAAMVLPAVLSVGLLSLTMPTWQAAAGTMGAWRYLGDSAITSSPFYALWMGTLSPWLSVQRLLLMVGMWLAVLLPMAAGAWLMGGGKGRRIVGGVLIAGVLVVLGWRVRQIDWLEIARPMPVAMLVCFAGLLWQYTRKPKTDEPARAPAPMRLTAIVFVAVAGLMLLKMVLYSRIWHYGFVLALPASMVLIIALLTWLPQLIAWWGGSAKAFRVAASLLLVIVVAGHLLITSQVLESKQTPVASGADRFIADWRGGSVNVLLEQLGKLARPGQTLAVLPEGVMVNYLARMPSSTRYTNLMPVEFAMYGEDAITRDFATHPPDWIALVHKDTGEYGKRFFGKDYGQSLMQWMTQHYVLVGGLGATPFEGDAFGVILLQRKP